MKILQIVAMAALTMGLSQMAYANHHEKNEMNDDYKHSMDDSDTNKDGAISREEYNAAHQKMADDMFMKMDTNKDGKIDQAERDAMKQKMSKHCSMKDSNMKDHNMNDSAK